MPKIKSVPGYNDSSFDMQNSPSKRFNRVDNQPQLRNGEYLTPIVPIHEVPYNPEFSKSPLASVQMSRTPHLRVADSKPKNLQYNTYDTDYHVEPHQQAQSNIDWKKIIFWALIALAIILLLIGLYFLISSLLSKKNSNKNLQTYQPDNNSQQKNQYYSGVNPIYVNPVPYSNLNPSVTTPTYNIAYTYPTTNPPVASTNSGKNTSIPPMTYPIVSQPSPVPGSGPVTQPTVSSSNPQPEVLWNANSSDNSVPPVDVYANRVK